MRSVYVAYPIDQAPAASMASFYEEVNKAKQDLLNQEVEFVYDPGDAWNVRRGAKIGPEIADVNNLAVDRCEGMLAFLPRGVASIGVPMEIMRAAHLGKPVAVVEEGRSWSMGGMYARANVQRFEHGAEATTWLANHQDVDPITKPLAFAVDKEGTLPTRAYEDDAGLDLYVSESVTIQPGQAVDVRCGVQVELPAWSWGLIVGRSSTARDRRLDVRPGVIDPGWRGDLFVNVSVIPVVAGDGIYVVPQPVKIEKGERLAQLIVMPNMTKGLTPVEVEALSNHPRGVSGFGSSGR